MNKKAESQNQNGQVDQDSNDHTNSRSSQRRQQRKRQTALENDIIAKGFHKLDSNLVSQHPPRIKWGRLYQDLSDKEKVKYLEKLAATMNHAAHLVQEERNDLLKLANQKEEQIGAMKKAMQQNTDMLHTEINKMNEERQKYNEAYKELKDELRKWQKSQASPSTGEPLQES